MDTQEISKATFLTVSKFQSIKTKILIFALLATILPSLVLGWLSYMQSSKLLRQKISNELNNATVQASGKLDLWLKDRQYDLRVFSNSYIISENLAAISSARRNQKDGTSYEVNIRDYLKSVGDKFTLYESLILMDMSGSPIVAGAEISTADPLPDNWLRQLKERILGGEKTHFPARIDSNALYIVEAVRASDSAMLGLLAAKIDLNAIRMILKRQTVGEIDEIYLLDASGRLLVSTSITAGKLQEITEHDFIKGSKSNYWPRDPMEYVNRHDRAVVGTAVSVTFMDWFMVAEMEKESAYAEIFALRRITTTLVCGLMLCIGILAYIFGHRLVGPVRRLSSEAARVASGDLDVDIPVSGLSEVSYLTQVFNHMVISLRRNREKLSSANQALRETNEELHQISITDSLTGLYNRKHIMEIIGQEKSRAQRNHNGLSVLMLDIDYFKKINDTYGHQVGDTVMARLAETLTASVRECDHVGRYGGEEFLVILPDSTVENAIFTAERIRANVGNLQFIEDHENFSVTVSIGVAGFPDHGENTHSILGCADSALYQAKAGGRNRVVRAEGENCRGLATIHPLPSVKRASNDVNT
ncbi:MAG: diguanylate cyclase [Desulfobacteraceae bacterium]